MFKQRLLMTLILLPLVLLGIGYLPSLWFAVLVLALMLGMLYEWQQFITMKAYPQVWFKCFILCCGSLLFLKFWNLGLYLDLLFWFVAIAFVIAYPKLSAIWSNEFFVSLNAWILVGVLGGLLIELQADLEGKTQLMALLFIVWAADIGAYLFGRRWGQHKMIPAVSPGKSWEGLFGGLLAVLIVARIEISWINPSSLYAWYLIAMMTGLFSVVGDLWMSVLKRRSKIKDSGHLIPGHGGLLDRLDSLLAALPVFYCATHLLNRLG